MIDTGDAVRFHAIGLVFRVVWKGIKVVTRFAVGMPLDGRGSTDSTFLSDGTTNLKTPGYWSLGKPTRWAYLAGYKRAMVRLLVVAALIMAAFVPMVVAWVAALVVAVALGLVPLYLVTTHRRRAHIKHYVKPLHVSLSNVIRIDETTRPTDWLDVPMDFLTPGQQIEIALPGDYNSNLNGELKRVVFDKLGISQGDMTMTVHMQGAEPSAVVTHLPSPPKSVTFSDMRKHLENASESAPVLGLDRQSAPVTIDFDAEAPHTLSSMAPGAGKSMLARSAIAHVLHHGGQVVMLDIKRHSHNWLRGVDGVTYLRDIHDIHNALIWMAVEAERRNYIADEDPDAGFTRFLVLCEEMNATIGKLRKYWAKIRTEKGEPSPAVEGLHELLFMGRAVKFNVWAIAQYGTAKTLGGTEARENFSNIILGRYSQRAWAMLAGDIRPMPRPSDQAGRVQVVRAGKATETQTIYWTDAEAREWAASGVPSQSPNLALPVPTSMDGVGTVPVSAVQLEETPAPADVIAGVSEPALVTLKEACDQGIITGYLTPEKALEGVRSAVKRDPEFPAPAGARGNAKLYRPEELRQWQRNRPRSAVENDEEGQVDGSTE